jgi:hypothetical protein
MRQPQISGFTLFENPGKGWQMSVRRQGEAGWDVSRVTAEQAAVILSLLEISGHPDGPWEVGRGDSLLEEMWYLTTAVRRLTGTIEGMVKVR